MANHTLKLPHGYRIECKTSIRLTDLGAKSIDAAKGDARAIFRADIYQDATKISRRYKDIPARTNTDVIDGRNAFLADIKGTLS